MSYSRRLAVFIQRLSDELPANKIAEIIDGIQNWYPEESELSGREKAWAGMLAHSNEELDAMLRARENQHIKARQDADLKVKEVTEFFNKDERVKKFREVIEILNQISQESYEAGRRW